MTDGRTLFGPVLRLTGTWVWRRHPCGEAPRCESDGIHRPRRCKPPPLRHDEAFAASVNSEQMLREPDDRRESGHEWLKEAPQPNAHLPGWSAATLDDKRRPGLAGREWLKVASDPPPGVAGPADEREAGTYVDAQRRVVRHG